MWDKYDCKGLQYRVKKLLTKTKHSFQSCTSVENLRLSALILLQIPSHHFKIQQPNCCIYNYSISQQTTTFFTNTYQTRPPWAPPPHLLCLCRGYGAIRWTVPPLRQSATVQNDINFTFGVREDLPKDAIGHLVHWCGTIYYKILLQLALQQTNVNNLRNIMIPLTICFQLISSTSELLIIRETKVIQTKPTLCISYHNYDEISVVDGVQAYRFGLLWQLGQGTQGSQHPRGQNLVSRFPG